MKKAYKPYVVGGLVLLVIIFLVFLLMKFSDLGARREQLKTSGQGTKAESFAPANQPTMSAKEKVIGSVKAPVKVIVYEDYSNIFSANSYETIDRIKKEYGDKIAVAVRPFAVKEKPESLEAAMAVECASEQDKWQEMREGIFRAVKANSLNSDGIAGWADQIGLNKEKFNKCLTDTQKQGIILQVATEAQQFSVYGAPTIFINDQLIVGARPYDDYQDKDGVKVEGLKTLIDRQLAQE